MTPRDRWFFYCVFAVLFGALIWIAWSFVQVAS